MADRPKDNTRSSSVRVQGNETAETETTSAKWPAIDLSVGDVVELRILPDNGKGDAPTEVRRTSESPSNLFSNPDLAKELFQIVADFDARVRELLSKSEITEPPDEHKKIKLAIGAVIYDHGTHLLYPDISAHKFLIPKELKGELL